MATFHGKTIITSTPTGMNNTYIGYNSSGMSSTGMGMVYHPFEKFNIKKIIDKIKFIKYKNGHKDYNFLKLLHEEKHNLRDKYVRLHEEIDFFNIRKNRILMKINENENEINKQFEIFHQTKLKDVVEIQYEPVNYSNAYDKCTILLRNGLIHSIDKPAVVLECYNASITEIFYLIKGEYYNYDNWLKHPTKILQDRKLKIEKLFN